LSEIGQGWAFSSLLFGCVLGSFFAGRLTDRFGRKRMLVWVAALFALTSITTALAPTFPLFICARFLGGVAVGGVSLLSPMYVAEVSPPSMRGRIGTFCRFSIISGILISYCINYLLRNTGPSNWRWMFLTGAIHSLVFLVLIALAPETPHFLVRIGKTSEAFRLLERVENEATAQEEIAAITAALQQSQQTWNNLRRPGVRRALAASVCLAILIHLSGINTIIDYAPKIFLSAGFKVDGALISTFFVGINNVVFTTVVFWVIDRYGRKPLYIIGSLGMSLALCGLLDAVLVGYFQGLLVLSLILLYLAFFASCVGPVFWTLVPEIFPSDVRGTAMIVPVLLQWVANAVVVLYFPTLFDVIGKSVTFSFLALMALTQALFTLRFIPETKSQPLEEIERHWIGSKP